jgi:hypothetical protein
MDSDVRHEIAVPIVGLLVVAGILYYSLPPSSALPTGYSVLPQKPGCCGDCSCPSEEVCSACDRCIWTGECSRDWGGLNPEGLELVHSGRVAEGGSFTLNAILHPQKDGQLLLNLRLPNGFWMEEDNPVPVKLQGGQKLVVPLKVHVKENVAETDHLIRADLVDYDWKVYSSAQASVSVWWGN